MKETTQPIPQGYEKFDLQRALSGDKVVTRLGQPVTEIYCFNTAVDSETPVRAAIGGGIAGFYKNGRLDPHTDNGLDLFMAPKPVVKYVNVYPAGSLGDTHDSIEIARERGVMAKSICRLEILNGEVVKAETVHRYQ